MYKYQFPKIDPYDWFCGPESQIHLTDVVTWAFLGIINNGIFCSAYILHTIFFIIIIIIMFNLYSAFPRLKDASQ